MSARMFDVLQTKPPFDANEIQQSSPVLESGEIILIDNVAEYYFDFLPDNFLIGDSSIKVPWSYNKNYPFVSPPFEEMWFEFETNKLNQIKRVGVKVKGMDMSSNVEWEALDPRLLSSFVKSYGENVISKVRWLLLITPYAELRNGIMKGPFGNYIIAVAPDGSLARSDDGDFIYAINSVNLEVAEVMQPLLINPVLMAISFMHVKNASIVKQTPVVPTTKNQRKKFKKNPPTSRYYVLKIDAIETTAKSGQAGHGGGGGASGGGGGAGGESSLHIVRGHFAQYTEEKPLFGKHSGKYWISSHLRGNPERGVVEKDYDLK